jgi:hypothetical protein
MRLAMFVDGWNMYGSLKSAGIRDYGWCDFRALARQQTGHADADVQVKFFTAADEPNPDKPLHKQKKWWEALEFTGCKIVRGEFRSISEEVSARSGDAGRKWREKMTDVALAAHMVADCNQIEPDPERSGDYRWKAGYDAAVLLTQDLDFVPAANIVASKPFSRCVYVLLPPSGSAAQGNAARNWREKAPTVSVRELSEADFARALLPRVVTGDRGQTVVCPDEWMWREKYESMQAAASPGRGQFLRR